MADINPIYVNQEFVFDQRNLDVTFLALPSFDEREKKKKTNTYKS